MNLLNGFARNGSINGGRPMTMADSIREAFEEERRRNQRFREILLEPVQKSLLIQFVEVVQSIPRNELQKFIVRRSLPGGSVVCPNTKSIEAYIGDIETLGREGLVAFSSDDAFDVTPFGMAYCDYLKRTGPVSLAKDSENLEFVHIPETQNMIKLFISHSSKDREFVKKLIELVKNALPLSASEIRCTSIDGHRLPGGASTNELLKTEVCDTKAFIGLISFEAIDSMYVLFELGARWGSNKHLLPLLAPGVSPDILKGPLSGLNALSCDSGSQLHQLVNDLADILEIKPEPSQAYQRYIEAILPIPPSEDKNLSAGDQDESLPSQTNIAATINNRPHKLTDPEDITSKLIWWLGQQREFVIAQAQIRKPVVWHFRTIDNRLSLTPGCSKEYLPKILNSNESPFAAIVKNVSTDTIRLEYDFSP